MDRSVIHLNIADFAAAVETCICPGLKNHPLVIAPEGAPRAVVYDMSDTAFKQGIRKGMDLARAKRIIPGVKILPPRFNRYEKAMRRITQKALAYTPRVEPGRTDGHLFMDVTGTSRLFGPPADVAFRLKKAFQKDLGLDPIWALATSKTVAKVATRLVKPLGEYIVAPGDEAQFLAPLPLSLIPGLEQDELQTLWAFNLSVVSQVRVLSPDQLRVPFPERANRIRDLVRGIDPEPVHPAPDAGDLIRAGHEFDNDTNDLLRLKAALYRMAEKICTILRRQKMTAHAARIVLSHSDGIRRQAGGKVFTANETAMFKICTRILDRAWTRRVRVRHMELICRKRIAQPRQGSLFREDAGQDRLDRIARAMDLVRTKFGPGIVRPALTLDKNLIFHKGHEG